jgi:WD40 repeat protein
VVEPAKPGPKAEPVARELIATLTHPDRKASVHTLKFSDDGQRLFTAGYPSGIVQVWDWADKKELRRFDTPRGLRSSANYAVLTPDWKTLYVPIENRKVASIEKDGKLIQRLEVSGRVGMWDVSSGEERTPLEIPEDHAPYFATITPDGRHLLTTERVSFTAGEDRLVESWVRDLQTGKRWRLHEHAEYPRISPDGKTAAFNVYDPQAQTWTLKAAELATGKELASMPSPGKDTMLLGGDFSPDGSLVIADLRGPKGSKPAILFLDSGTFAERGRFEGAPDKDGRGFVSTFFAPGGKSCILLDGAGTAHVWDLSAMKVVRTFEVGAPSWQAAFSPDGKTWAVAWAPRNPDEKVARTLDWQDRPQPRATLFDLTGTKPPHTLIAPHGSPGGLAFTPNGKTLAFGTTGGVRIFDLSK